MSRRSYMSVTYAEPDRVECREEGEGQYRAYRRSSESTWAIGPQKTE
jgi:hypothetical protein